MKWKNSVSVLCLQTDFVIAENMLIKSNFVFFVIFLTSKVPLSLSTASAASCDERLWVINHSISLPLSHHTVLNIHTISSQIRLANRQHCALYKFIYLLTSCHLYMWPSASYHTVLTHLTATLLSNHQPTVLPTQLHQIFHPRASATLRNKYFLLLCCYVCLCSLM